MKTNKVFSEDKIDMTVVQENKIDIKNKMF